MASIAEIITHLHKQSPDLRVRGSADRPSCIEDPGEGTCFQRGKGGSVRGVEKK
jgi:hypothetical protein